MPLLGVLPHDPSLVLPSRHLGLLPPGELEGLADRRQQWASLASSHLDLERLWPLLAPPQPLALGHPDPILWTLERASLGCGDGSALWSPAAGPEEQVAQSWPQPVVDPLPRAAAHASGLPSRLAGGSSAAVGQPMALASPAGAPLPVAIASDLAFHFRYPEVSELLRALGLDPQPWSPLADEPLPAGCRAVLLPGGYPELHAEQLAACRRSLGELAAAARAGLPIVAECGGLLLLGHVLHDQDDRPHSMAGVLPFSARRGSLTLGYRHAEVRRDGLLVRRGERLIGHEFHRWQLQPDPTGVAVAASAQSADADASMAMQPGLWQLEGWGWPGRPEGWTNATLHASWLHLHWAGCPEIPLRLAAAAANAVPQPTSDAFCSPKIPAPRDRSAGG